MATYHIALTESPTGTWTPLVRNGGTPASGGTVLLGGGSNLASTFAVNSPEVAGQCALLIAANDRAAGN